MRIRWRRMSQACSPRRRRWEVGRSSACSTSVFPGALRAGGGGPAVRISGTLPASCSPRRRRWAVFTGEQGRWCAVVIRPCGCSLTMTGGEQGRELATSQGVVAPRAGDIDRESVAERLRVAAG